jgi:hypothetical protein
MFEKKCNYHYDTQNALNPKSILIQQQNHYEAQHEDYTQMTHFPFGSSIL